MYDSVQSLDPKVLFRSKFRSKGLVPFKVQIQRSGCVQSVDPKILFRSKFKFKMGDVKAETTDGTQSDKENQQETGCGRDHFWNITRNVNVNLMSMQLNGSVNGNVNVMLT